MADPRRRQHTQGTIGGPEGPPGEGRRAFLLAFPVLALVATLVAIYGVTCSETGAGGFCPRLPEFSLPSAPPTPEASLVPSPIFPSPVAPSPIAPTPAAATNVPPPSPATAPTPTSTASASLFVPVQDRIRAALVERLQPEPAATGMVATVRARKTVSRDLVKDVVETLKRIGFEARQEDSSPDVAGERDPSPGEIYVRSAPQRRSLAILIVEGVARVSPQVIQGQARIGVRPLAGGAPQSNGRYDPIIVDMF
jgi:hypothetical protein